MQNTANSLNNNLLSRVDKKIKLKAQDHSTADKVSYEHSLTPATSRILTARGYTIGKELSTYLKPTLKEGLPAPSEMKNLEAAAALIAETIEAKKSIAICCDFDVDGLSSGSQVYHYLKALGVTAKVYVPDRFKDGYGLNSGMIEDIARNNFSLVITLDYGTTNFDELNLARKLGLKSIVVDHHHVEKNPPADIFVNPAQEGCGFADGTLCAAGLAWYLIIAIRKALPSAKDIDPKSYLDLACLGTICDMVPLRGVNRIIAKRGLEILSHTERVGLQALKNVIGVRGNVGCSNVSFGIGPRLNAAGRMVHGSLVIELLTTDNETLAGKLAKKLHKLNKQRQEVEEKVKESALRQAAEYNQSTSALVVWGDDFHTGVIGIVAQRLVESFYKPSVVMGLEEDIYKGSVRGIKGFNVVGALSECSEFLDKFGGHAGAGGFSLQKENIEKFRDKFIEVCKEKLATIETVPFVEADTKVTLTELTPALVKELRQLEPFGIGNPGPVLLIDNLEVKEVKVLKNAHLKVSLTNGQVFLPGLMWRHTSHDALQVGNRVKVACKADINNFRGINELQATIQAVEIIK